MGTSSLNDSTTAARHQRRTSQLAASFLLPSSSAEASSSGGNGSGTSHTFPDKAQDEEERQHGDGDNDNDALSTASRSSMSGDSEVVEMDYINEVDDHFNSDEEAGLTPHQRKKLLHMRRRQRRQLDSRIVDLKISVSGRRLADRKVLKKLSINTVFILLWYIFSLSISVVS
jgi:solute carrier family 35 protein C2